jgi:ABC-2 type transport system permease protein
MNIFDKFFLMLFLLPAGLYRKLDVNTAHLRAILVAKLTMDNRRPAAFQQMRQTKEKKELNKATLKTMMGSLFMGLLFLFSFQIGNDLVIKLTMYFTMFIFILAATLITDFTSVLIDIRDNLIILPKPVTDATFVTARLLHIAIHINKVVIPMILPALIAIVVIKGVWALLPFMVSLLLATMLSIFIINAVYILILKITTPAKFQSIISYIQIGFAILIYGGYQLFPRIIDNSVMQNLQISQVKYIRLYPPFWFAEACDSLCSFQFSSNQLISIALSVIVPLASILVVVKYFAPAFNQKLAMINSNTVENKTASVEQKGKGYFSVSRVDRLAGWLTARGGEYMGFVFTWKMMSRSRDFKMKVYPAFGYVIVLLVMMLLKSKSPLISDLHQLTDKGKVMFLFLVYFSSFIVLTAIGQLAYSEKYKAGWLFFISPIETPGTIISGALKSALAYFYTPILLVFAILGVLFVGPGILPNLVLGCFNILAICSLIAYFNLREFPFSVSASNASKGRTMIRSMITLIVPAAFGFFQWIIFDYTWIVMIFAALAIIATWMVLDSIKKMSWTKLGSSRNQ